MKRVLCSLLLVLALAPEALAQSRSSNRGNVDNRTSVSGENNTFNSADQNIFQETSPLLKPVPLLPADDNADLGGHAPRAHADRAAIVHSIFGENFISNKIAVVTVVGNLTGEQLQARLGDINIDQGGSTGASINKDVAIVNQVLTARGRRNQISHGQTRIGQN